MLPLLYCVTQYQFTQISTNTTVCVSARVRARPRAIWCLCVGVPVNYVPCVEVVESADDLAGVEVGSAVVEATHAAKIGEQLPSRHKLHQHVQERLVLVPP
jgi:hypothetical protein